MLPLPVLPEQSKLFPPLPGSAEDKILVVDNYMLSMFQTCPAKFKRRIVEGWKPRKQGAALGFGQMLHLGIEVWYRTHSLEAAEIAVQEAWPANHPDDDWRDLSKCISVLGEYTREYPSELWRVVDADKTNPMLEVSFTLPLLDANGNQLYTYDGYAIQYGGIFDLMLDFNGQFYIMDHKTTTRLGDYYFNQYKPNNQITGYLWGASQLTNRRVGGAFINAIGLYKKSPTKFKRHLTVRSEDDFPNWVQSVQHACNLIRIAYNSGQWPQFTSACTLYGNCEFRDVHVMGSNTQQERYLEMMYEKEHWNHESRGSALKSANLLDGDD